MENGRPMTYEELAAHANELRAENAKLRESLGKMISYANEYLRELKLGSNYFGNDTKDIEKAIAAAKRLKEG